MVTNLQCVPCLLSSNLAACKPFRLPQQSCPGYLIGNARQGCALKALGDAPPQLVRILDALEEEAVVCTAAMQ